MIVVNFVVSHSVGIKGTCSPSSHFFMCRPNSSSCGLSFRFAAGGVRVETDWPRSGAMTQLGNGLSNANHHADALSVREAKLSMEQRLGTDEDNLLVSQCNLANSYEMLGRDEEALGIRQDVYSGRLKLNGKEHESTLLAANNYAASLKDLKHSDEAKSLLQKTIPVARRVLGEGHELTLTMRWLYAEALYEDPDATLDDLREAVTSLEDTTRIARRVMGGAHPLTVDIEDELRDARAALRVRETPPPSRSA